jgi:hypothetical protein
VEMFRLDYLSCLLTVVATILVGRKQWTGLVVSGVNSLIVCVIGVHTFQYGFIPANVFCICINAFNLKLWLSKGEQSRRDQISYGWCTRTQASTRTERFGKQSELASFSDQKRLTGSYTTVCRKQPTGNRNPVRIGEETNVDNGDAQGSAGFNAKVGRQRCFRRSKHTPLQQALADDLLHHRELP